MGISQIPTTPSNVWTQLATTTISGNPSSVSFTSISNSYRNLLFTFNNITTSGTTDIRTRFNNDSASNYSFNRTLANGAGDFVLASGATSSLIALGRSDTLGNPVSGWILITGANDIYKIVTYNTYQGTIQYASYDGNAAYIDATAINRIDLLLAAGTLGTGTATLYGSN